MVQCAQCGGRGIVRRPKTGAALCRACFLRAIEDEVHETVVAERLFRPGMRVALGASGGKDSTVLAHVIPLLNARHGYGLDLRLLSIDEGIAGYRDDSLAAVRRNAAASGLPLAVLPYARLYGGWTMDRVVAATGRAVGACTFCGVFRRQALDRGAGALGADVLLTGHNADDIAETVLMNLLRGDVPRLRRCTEIVTGEQAAEAPCGQPGEYNGTGCGANSGCAGACGCAQSACGADGQPESGIIDVALANAPTSSVPRAKPLKWTYEKEIVMYAYHARLDYFSTECTYAPAAFRGHARALLRELALRRPRVVLDVIRSGEAFAWGDTRRAAAASCSGLSESGELCTGEKTQPSAHAAPRREMPVRRPAEQTLGACARCGYMTSQRLCKACVMLDALNSL